MRTVSGIVDVRVSRAMGLGIMLIVCVGTTRLAYPSMAATAIQQSRTGAAPKHDDALFVYSDAASSRNHYKPTGRMGDTGDISIDESYDVNPNSGSTSIRVVYQAKGAGPNICRYSPPCKWAGVQWLHPPDNWGTDQVFKGKGFALSTYNRLVFAARADKPAKIEFKVGGIDAPFGDSLKDGRGTVARLTDKWQEFEIDLAGADLRHIIGGFSWVTNWDMNPQGVTFYLDDIRFEKK